MRCWDRSSGSERSRRPHRRKINPGPPAQRFMKPPLSRYIALAQRRTTVLMSRRGPLLENKDGEKKIAVPPSAPGAAWTGARYHEHHHGSTLMKTASIIAAASAL